MKKIAIWALPLAATLALTGCSGLLGSDSTESPTPSPAATAEAAPTTPEASNTTSVATETTSDSGFSSDYESPSDSGTADTGSDDFASADQISPSELVDVAKAIESYYEKGGVTIAKDAELRAASEQLASMMGEMDVTPAVCNSVATSSTNGMLDKMNMVSLTLPGDANSDLTTISIASYEEASKLDEVLSMAKAAVMDCSNYSMSMAGREVEVRNTAAQANTNAADTLITMGEATVMKSADGTSEGKETRTLIVSGYDGVNNVAVTITNPTDDAAAVARAEEYVDLALLHIAGV